MANLLIKNVPDEVVVKLRARAKAYRRSVQCELLALVSAAVNTPVCSDGSISPALTIATGTKAIEEIAAEHRANQVEPIADAPMAVDIIRRDRDMRS